MADLLLSSVVTFYMKVIRFYTEVFILELMKNI